MASHEYRNIAYLVSALLGFGLYSYYVIQRYQGGEFDATTIDSSWGWLVLGVIVAQVALSIIAAIVVTIIQAIIEGEEAPELTDERDQLIELRGDRMSYIVFGVGFVLAMLALAMGQPPLIMFHLIVYSIFGAAIVGNITQMVLHRRGF